MLGIFRRTMDDNTPNLVTLERHLDYSEGLVVCSLLAAHGFIALRPDAYYIAVRWFHIFALGGVRIQVPRSMAGEARALLNDVRADQEVHLNRECRLVKRTLALAVAVLFGIH